MRSHLFTESTMTCCLAVLSIHENNEMKLLCPKCINRQDTELKKTLRFDYLSFKYNSLGLTTLLQSLNIHLLTYFNIYSCHCN